MILFLRDGTIPFFCFVGLKNGMSCMTGGIHPSFYFFLLSLVPFSRFQSSTVGCWARGRCLPERPPGLGLEPISSVCLRRMAKVVHVAFKSRSAVRAHSVARPFLGGRRAMPAWRQRHVGVGRSMCGVAMVAPSHLCGRARSHERRHSCGRAHGHGRRRSKLRVRARGHGGHPLPAVGAPRSTPVARVRGHAIIHIRSAPLHALTLARDSVRLRAPKSSHRG